MTWDRGPLEQIVQWPMIQLLTSTCRRLRELTLCHIERGQWPHGLQEASLQNAMLVALVPWLASA